MNEFATDERRLISTLGDTLASADQRLLEGVRRVAAEDEARRGAVTLAARLFVLPRPREQAATLEEAPQEEPTCETGQIVRRGDWRAPCRPSDYPQQSLGALDARTSTLAASPMRRPQAYIS
jgi:hypothetical protein